MIKIGIKSTMYLTVVLTSLFHLTSCKVTESKISGLYKMKHFPKSTLTIKSDTTFEFIQNYRNPYLHPFEHPDDNYFRTIGHWTLQNDILTLNSTKDSLTYKLYDVVTSDTGKSKFCSYVFYDIYKDTVPILFVRTKRGDISRLHGSMEDFSYDKNKQESLQFFFFGYRPLTIINSQNGETNYQVYLQPEFRPKWFVGTTFKAKKNRLMYITKKIVFKK
jgi:hypothetical protein